MLKKYFISLIITCLLTTLAKAGYITLGDGLNYSYQGSTVIYNSQTQIFNNPKNQLGIMAFVGYDFNNVFGIELEYSNLLIKQGESNNTFLNTIWKFNQKNSKYTPFLKIGFGIMHLKQIAHISNIHSNNQSLKAPMGDNMKTIKEYFNNKHQDLATHIALGYEYKLHNQGSLLASINYYQSTPQNINHATDIPTTNNSKYYLQLTTLALQYKYSFNKNSLIRQ